jgi:polyhydroxybutyrate depolymerase
VPFAPLVMVLHGYTGSPSGIERFAELTPAANAASIAVAYPEGGPTTVGGFGWASGANVFATADVDDVAALGEMLDALIGTGCVDPTRVTVAGESNGAGMALAAACDPRFGPRIGSVVLVIPAVDEGVLDRCASGAPVAVAMSVVAGELDETVPFGGGNGLLAQEEWFASASWLLAGCTAIAPRAAVDDWTNVVSGTSCETCSVLFVVADGTHTWPGASRGTGGLRPGTFDLNGRLVWSAAAPPPLPCLPW